MNNLSLQNSHDPQGVGNIVYHSLAKNTWLAYEKGWRRFETYCRQTGRVSLPASVETIISFLVYLSNEPKTLSKKPISMGTIILYRSAIQKAHQLSNHQSPTNHPKVCQIIAGLKRMLGTAPKRVSALRDFHIKQMLKKCSNTPIGARDAAILALGFAGALRRSEICQLKYEDIQIINATKTMSLSMTITIRKSKTDQEGKGQKIAIVEGDGLKPISVLLKWLKISKIEEGYLFQSLFKGGRLRGNKMHHSDIPRIVKHYGSLIGIDSADISGHSLRAGFVTSAVAHGARLDKIMETTRHKTPQTVLHYMRDKDLFNDHAGAGFL